MTAEELFLKEGASYFGNRLIWKHIDVGVKFPGSALALTPEGEEAHSKLADITDVEVKPVKPKKAKAQDVLPAEDAGLDSLLGE